MENQIKQLLQTGMDHHNVGHLDEAKACYEKVLTLNPNQSDAIHFLGVVATAKGEVDTAVAHFNRAIAIAPDNPACHNNLGNLHQSQQNYLAAISCYEKTLELNPQHHMAYNNIGAAHIRLGNYDTAHTMCRKALDLEPNYAAAWNNLGDCCSNLGQLEEALSYYDKALKLEPEMVDANWNRALCLLHMGDLAQGFAAYHWRWKRQNTPRRDIDPHLKWNGSNFCGRSIFIYEEQGLGDTLQFVRYLPYLKAAGGRVILECSPALVRLLEPLDCIDKLWVRKRQGSTRDIDRFDSHCPIMDLPHHFQTTRETIPVQVPYIHADAAMTAWWKPQLGDSSDFKVGIVWAGNPNHRNNRHRSCKLSAFEGMAKIPGVSLYGLQKDKYPEWTDVELDQVLTRDLGDALFDFADTAALVANMDLVITVDTAVAHLAGAMGKPTWVILPLNADWRWMRQGETSAWYPSMTLFRQAELGQWEAVFKNMEEKLVQNLSEK